MKFLRKKIFISSIDIRLFDRSLFVITIILIIIGLTFLCSSSSAISISRYHNAYVIFLKQLIWTAIAFIIMIYFSIYNLEKLRKKIPYMMILIILLLIITLFMPPIQNTRRWIPLKMINLQTSEFAKIAILLYLSHFIDKYYSKINNIKILLKPAIVISIILILIAFEPDLGTPILILITSLAVFFISGIRISHILMPVIIALPLLIIEITRHPYRKDRIEAFLNPWLDPSGKSFQLVQSLAAIGSGWWFGKGPGNSIMKLRYLPETHTDFIFPIIAEETGFIGVVVIIILFLLFFLRTLVISKRASSLFLTTLAFSCGFMITFQALFNIAMSAGLLPTKGLPLPFFSYGGSSIIANMIMVGFILNTSMRRKKI